MFTLLERAREHLVGGRVVPCWDARSCEVCSPLPITGRLDPYRLRNPFRARFAAPAAHPKETQA